MMRRGLLAATAVLTACAHAQPAPTPVPSSAPIDAAAPLDPAPASDAPPPLTEIPWIPSAPEARARAADEHKPLVVFVRADWSQPSILMDHTIWTDARILREMPRFIALRIDLTKDFDHSPEATIKEYALESVPTTLVVASDGTVVGRFGAGVARAADVADAMKRTH